MSAVAIGGAVAAGVAGAVVSSALAPSPGGGSSGAAAADPFAGQRGQYQTMLQTLMTGKDQNGNSVNFNSTDPSYQFRFNQGEQAVDRAQAAGGDLFSGNRLTALQDYGQQSASQEYNNQFIRLAQLSGANSGSPGTAGQLTAAQTAQQQQGATALGNVAGGAVQSGINYFTNGSAPANGEGTSYGGTGSVTSTPFTSGTSPDYGASAASYGGFGYGA